MRDKIEELDHRQQRERTSVFKAGTPFWRRLTFFYHFLRGQIRFRPKLLDSPDERQLAYRLRARVFGELLGWVDVKSTEGEVDQYDDSALHFGVFEGSNLIACGRVLRGDTSWMLEKDFCPLVQGVDLRKRLDALEISRLSLSENLIRTPKGRCAQTFLYRAIYRWSRIHGVRYWYIVVGQKYYDRLKSDFGFQQIGNAYCFEEGFPVVAALIDFRHAEEHLRRNHWLALKWYTALLE